MVVPDKFSVEPLSALAVVDGQGINLASMPDLIEKVRLRVATGVGFSLVTLNLDHLVKRRSDASFTAAYARATFVTADGAPIVELARRQGTKIERTTGADLIDPLCAMAEHEGFSLFFFGSTALQLEAAAHQLCKRYPRLKIAGYEAPDFGFDPHSDVALAAGERIAASGATFCLIVLGAPKQEMFADTMLVRHPNIGFFCVGAALDFIAGGQKRAPAWMQAIYLEWVWRLLSNPRRLALRYARCARLMLELLMRSKGRQSAASATRGAP